MGKQEAVLIYPHQLFKSHPALEVDRQVFLIEDERFFSAFRFHKQKLVLHRASLQAYARRLGRRYRLTYLNYDQSLHDDMAARLRKGGVRQIHTARLCDTQLADKVRRIAECIGADLTMHPTPMFITADQDLEDWFGQRRNFHMASFYQYQRKRLGVLVEENRPVGGKWSFDAENRRRLPRDITVPSPPSLKPNPHTREAIDYVNKHFPENPGRAEGYFYPVTHRQAEAWLEDFFQRRLANFGPYEDAISKDHAFLFHSVLTPMLNIGLLTPGQVLKKVLEFHRTDDVPLASLEGFIRQVIGWREFMWGVYKAAGQTQRQGNFWGCKNNLPGAFYDGTTGILPVDTLIRRVLEHAYCHHIERLMILGNFMLLCEINPDEVYRSFIELFIDSYDWVMVPNVYGMSQYADGGRMTTKPYISSSNYIRKMSDFPRGKWCDIWDGLFWRFVDRNREVFFGNPRMRMMALQLDRMEDSKKDRHHQIAESFLQRQFS